MGTLPIDVQLLSIDEEALLEWPDFEALRDASGFLFLELPHLQALLCFFEQWGDPDMAESEGQHSHFRLLDAEALRTYQVNRWIIESSTGNYYLYMPDEGTGYAGECLLTVLTDHWGMPHHLIGPLCRHERVTGMPHLPSWLLLAPLAEADPLTPQPITRRRLAAIVAILRQLPFDLAQPSEYFLFFCAR